MRDDGLIDVADIPDGRPVSGLQLRVFALCGLAAMIDGYDIQAIGLALPSLARDWQIPAAQFSDVLAASVVGIAIGGIGLAPLADRWGRRPLLIGAMALLAISTLATAFAIGMADLLAWRFMTGVSLGASIPVALALASEYAPAERRTAIVLLLSCAIPIGSAAGSFIAPLIDNVWGWRGILAIGGILPAAAGLLLWAALPESLQILVRRKPNDPRVDAILSAMAPDVGASRLFVNSPPESKGAVAALFSRTLRARTLIFWLVFSGNVFVNYYMINWLPTLLHEQGWTSSAALRGASFYAMGGLIGGIGLTWMVAKWNPIAVLAGTYAITAIMFALFLVIPDRQLAWFAILLVAGCGGHGAALAILAVIAVNYPASVGATALGWAGSVARSGGILAAYVGAVLLNLGTASSHVLGALLVPALCCAIGIALLPLAMREKSALNKMEN